MGTGKCPLGAKVHINSLNELEPCNRFIAYSPFPPHSPPLGDTFSLACFTYISLGPVTYVWPAFIINEIPSHPFIPSGSSITDATELSVHFRFPNGTLLLGHSAVEHRIHNQPHYYRKRHMHVIQLINYILVMQKRG